MQFLERTWREALAVLLFWGTVLYAWLRFEPALVKDVRDLDSRIAEMYRAVCDGARPRLRNIWIAGGALAIAAYVVTVINGPHQNWTATTLVPLVRGSAEFFIGVAIGQAVDLLLRGGPIIGNLIRKKKSLKKRLGLFWPVADLFLQNINAVFAFLLLLFVLWWGYDGAPSDIVLNIAAALFVSRYIGSISSELDNLEALI
jgi:hypothetical protein